ncbi:hypothetical protein J4433_02345 [Candidatus Pacearchaeota archaeon]|nr:hypothetical protein [Candidatus Pacearchaeota archaeon]
MYELKIAKLREMPVFSLADISQIVSGKEYAKKLAKRLVKANALFKIKRGLYTFYDDPFLVSSFLLKPSYISSASALSYHKLITQLPKDIFCFTSKQKKKLDFVTEILFFHTNYFFGFEMQKYENFILPVATPEKAVIDSLGILPISVFEEAMEKIDLERMLAYLKKIGKSCFTKRIGYLLEKNGFDVYDRLKKGINNKYILLDTIAKKEGAKDKRWKLIINVR